MLRTPAELSRNGIRIVSTLHEPGISDGVRIEAHADKFADAGADRHHGVVEHEARVARDQKEREEVEDELHVHVRDPPHAARDAL